MDSASQVAGDAGEEPAVSTISGFAFAKPAHPAAGRKVAKKRTHQRDTIGMDSALSQLIDEHRKIATSSGHSAKPKQEMHPKV